MSDEQREAAIEALQIDIWFKAMGLDNDDAVIDDYDAVLEMVKEFGRQSFDAASRHYEQRIGGGVGLIAAERQRQIEVEGWTPEHDDEHTGAGLAVAGACYALESAAMNSDEDASWKEEYRRRSVELFPFDSEWWKPGIDPIRNLVKAGALIAAEIDRLQRQAKTEQGE